MSKLNDMIATVIREDETVLGNLLVQIPEEMTQEQVVSHILMLAQIEQVMPHDESMVYIAMRPADPEEDYDFIKAEKSRTIH